MFNGLSIPYIGKTNLSVKKSAAKTLRASLNQLTKKQLDFICESYSDETFSTKEELVDYLDSAILSTCGHFFFYENKAVYDLMLMFLAGADDTGGKVDTELKLPDDEKNEHEIFIYMFNSGIVKHLMHHGYIFHHFDGKEEFYSIPIEVCREVSSYVDKRGKNPFGKWEIFHQFADCMISLYGVLTVRDFGKLWKIKYPEIELSDNQIIEHMSFSSVTTRDYKWHDKLNAIAYKYFKESDVKGIIEDRNKHSIYIPESVKLNAFLDDYMNSDDEYQLNYFEMYEVEHNNPNYVQMRKFLEKYRKDDWDEILYYMMYYIKDGRPVTHVIEYLNEDFKLTESLKKTDVEQFLKLYQNLHNSTHLWVNYGWSPDELSSQHRQESIQKNPYVIPFPKELTGMNFQAIPKVGRNEPCPCGSGKKYKQCHGK